MRMHKNDKCNEEAEYQIDQANLIRNLNDDLMKVIINPTNDNIREFTFGSNLGVDNQSKQSQKESKIPP